MNILAMLLCLFFPWGLFTTLLATLSFKVHYEHPVICFSIVLAALLAIVCMGMWTVQERLRLGRNSPTERNPSWSLFMCISLVVAFLVAGGLGQTNYYDNLKPYYDYLNLGTYHNIFPDRVRGQQIMDAGGITFAEGSHLSTKLSQGFKDDAVYCVAPIVYGNETLATYDFWAVGKDCCSGAQADFHCQGYNDPLATGALRLMREDDRPFYRLAVQQAEATYDIKAVHPLFFRWVHDVHSEVQSWNEAGWQTFYAGICSYFLLQAFLVATAAAVFSKLGRH